jgi:hypothetical protein
VRTARAFLKIKQAAGTFFAAENFACEPRDAEVSTTNSTFAPATNEPFRIKMAINYYCVDSDQVIGQLHQTETTLRSKTPVTAAATIYPKFHRT